LCRGENGKEQDDAGGEKQAHGTSRNQSSYSNHSNYSNSDSHSMPQNGAGSSTCSRRSVVRDCRSVRKVIEYRGTITIDIPCGQTSRASLAKA
jgi:hypothetical protein